MPKLKSFTFESCYETENAALVNFFQLNTQLRKLALNCCLKRTSQIISWIVQFIPDIKRIEFKGYFYYLENLFTNANQLKALKSLEIDCRDNSFSSIVSLMAKAHIPLGTLILLDCNIPDPELSISIANLKHLKNFTITTSYLDGHMDKMDIIIYRQKPR